MGRLFFFLVVAIFILFLIIGLDRYELYKRSKKNNMTQKEKRESFDSDIEAVAKEIKKRPS